MSLYWLNKNRNNFEQETDETTKKEKISSFLDDTIKNSRTLNFLLGSGCSLPAIPLMKEMINLIKDEEKIKKIISDYSFEINNIEDFLNWLNSGKHFLKDNITKQIEYEEAINLCKKIIISSIKNGIMNNKSYYETIEKYINFYNEVIKIRSLNEKHNSPIDPINVFTTNYDLFNEIALEECSILYTTGFQGEVNRKFNPSNFRFRIVDSENRYKDKWDPYNAFINIYKIHGSINWVWKNNEIKQIDFIKSNIEIEAIIYPTINKNNETLQMPYSQLFREFSIQLQKSNSTLIIIGYGFSDEHINQLILQSLSNETFNLIIFGNINEKNIKKFKEENKAKSNLHFIGGTDSNNNVLSHFQNIINLLTTNNRFSLNDINAIGSEKSA